MKNKYCLFIAAFLSVLFAPVVKNHAQENIRLKVVSFNVRSFEPDFNIAPYAEVLRTLDADIICLNEVENRSSRMQLNGKYRDVVQELGNQLAMFGIFGYSYNLSNKDGKLPETDYTFSENELYGNAILSKYPVMNSLSLQLPRPASSADQRSVLAVDVLLSPSVQIRVAVSHLDHVGGRMEQVKVLVSDKIADTRTPVILAGDMNAGPGSGELTELLTKFERLDGDEGTYEGISKIDYILGSKAHWKLVGSKTIAPYDKDGKELSDHWILYSEIELIK
ncbi:endonuclease/exonuclease/phosphatase family protein [Bacteroides sp. AN502(2024)]|uniref:endonuclease/exonuclease/phosphatase family protein n=1 Tax=Bacteroides sp. AN502(2024) TaxID=3160599 RepID=UPI0035147567